MGLREGGAEGEAQLLAAPLDGVAKGVSGAEALEEAEVRVEPDSAAEALRQPLAEAEPLPPPPNGDRVTPLAEDDPLPSGDLVPLRLAIGDCEVEGDLLAAAL